MSKTWQPTLCKIGFSGRVSAQGPINFGRPALPPSRRQVLHKVATKTLWCQYIPPKTRSPPQTWVSISPHFLTLTAQIWQHQNNGIGYQIESALKVRLEVDRPLVFVGRIENRGQETGERLAGIFSAAFVKHLVYRGWISPLENWLTIFIWLVNCNESFCILP